MPDVTICEMAPRDGLQVLNREARISLDLRVRLIETLQRAGFPYIEVGSFVSPKYVPAMADTTELFAQLKPFDGQLAALVPNHKYFDKLRSVPHVDTVALFVSASEEYSQKNVGCGIDEALDRAARVADAARQSGYKLRAHVSGALRDLTSGNGATPATLVASICQSLIKSGCEIVALADTDGRAGPDDIVRVIRHIRDTDGLDHIGVHLHDRYGIGLANALVAYQEGVRVFDCAVGGIGGAVVSSDSVGNIATEELVYLFSRLGVETGVDLNCLLEALRQICEMTQIANVPMPPSRFVGQLS